MAMSAEHQALFLAYTAELSAAAELATRARAKEIESAVKSGTPEDTAQLTLTNQKGPAAAHPRVLGIIIKYFFLCTNLNEKMGEEGKGFVEPLVFVHEMLSGGHQDLWDFVAELPYLPLGLRKDESRV